MELTEKQKKVSEELMRVFNSPLGQKIFKYHKERANREGPLSKKSR
jgi:hypothetical protein